MPNTVRKERFHEPLVDSALSSAELKKLAEGAVRELAQFIDWERDWPELERDEDGVRIFAQESPFPELKERILRVDAVVEVSVEVH